jgi:hypothetical protein
LPLEILMRDRAQRPLQNAGLGQQSRIDLVQHRAADLHPQRHAERDQHQRQDQRVPQLDPQPQRLNHG